MEIDDLLPISALEHLLYCPRQCALIHIDGVWVENVHTAAGRILHERVDAGGESCHPDVRVVRSPALRSERLGLRGIADVVEFYPLAGGRWRPYPVEYKRGRRRAWLHNDVQLAAQAMALEEMTGESVPEGAIFHGATQRRRMVSIDDALRAETLDAAQRLHAMVASRRVPLPVLDARCDQCSLRAVCQPEHVGAAGELAAMLQKALR